MKSEANSIIRKRIAKRVAKELHDGDIVNLGIGLPSLVADEVNNNIEVLFHAENGLMGIDSLASLELADPDLINAGAQHISAVQGASYFDSADSFAIIRGGHVDVSVLGALEVDEHGNLASWIIPGKMVPGMGGAMDLVVGAKKVIVAMEHTNKGKPKLLKQCTLPLTAVNQVNLIVTELGVFEVTPSGLLMKEIAEGISIDEVQDKTEASILVDRKTLKIFS
ncbi:3-oxoacid CoA-transferase subunit B [Vibrio marisflavi]|uniref:Butyrate--acetoacetate CoA-transferase subunit B n=1 Tax=Vibrio marisflavi CECT 7928 TaxID=634439 RepID=A0ABM9A0S6_9VIBR|nr:3-oxoacid CoA-transferase subunit B [Vibrio marisflavi]CAH0537119.1 Butyrate--acetoacetate CoA-transferase subunit B [Vibrio marisflavi CECT 7928]